MEHLRSILKHIMKYCEATPTHFQQNRAVSPLAETLPDKFSLCTAPLISLKKQSANRLHISKISHILISIGLKDKFKPCGPL